MEEWKKNEASKISSKQKTMPKPDTFSQYIKKLAKIRSKIDSMNKLMSVIHSRVESVEFLNLFFILFVSFFIWCTFFCVCVFFLLVLRICEIQTKMRNIGKCKQNNKDERIGSQKKSHQRKSGFVVICMALIVLNTNFKLSFLCVFFFCFNYYSLQAIRIYNHRFPK